MRAEKRNYTNEQKYYIGFFIIIVFILFLRAPEIILKGRFWAEEGTLYFKYAYEHNIIENIFFVYFRCGYYYFSANLSALFAALVPLELSPFISTLCSFSVTVLILYAIYFTPSYLLKNNFLKIIFCMYLVIGPQVVAEVYCNSINTQVYWGIFGVVSLFFDFETLDDERVKRHVPKRRFLHGMLLAACLSGLYCVILFPFFILKYFIKRDKGSLIQIKYMIAPFILQCGLVIYSKFFAGLASSKMSFNSFGMESITYSLKHQLVRPLLGISAMKKSDNFSIGSLLFCIAILMALFSFYIYLYRNKRESVVQNVTLIILYVYYFIFVQIGALSSGGAGGRYAFISGSIIYLALLLSIWGIYEKIRMMTILVVIFIPLIVGGYDFQGTANWKYLDYSEAPNWKSEVEKFEKNNNYELKCWPYHKEWHLKLIEK